MKPRLFFLDDDALRLDEWKASLTQWEANWELAFFRFRKDLHAAIEKEAPAMVVTRQAMNRSPGLTVLEQLSKRHPGIRLILLAPREDRENLQAASDSNITILPDDYTAEALEAEINRLLALEVWLGNERLTAVIARMGNMPSLPSVYLEVMKLIESPDSSLEDLARLVAKDLAMSAKLLQVVNSSYFGVGEKVSEIPHAVRLLGTEMIKNTVLAIQLFKRTGNNAEERALVDQIWRQSMSVANAARKIAHYETENEEAAEEAYTAGLFHDMGKLLLLRARPEEFQKARELSRTEKIPSWEAEDSLIGCHHAEVGAYLLGGWHMPLPLIEAVAFHHQPQRSVSQGFSTLAAVHAASCLVWARSGLPDHPEAKVDEDYLASIGCLQRLPAWAEIIRGRDPSAALDEAAKATTEETGKRAPKGGAVTPSAVTSEEVAKKETPAAAAANIETFPAPDAAPSAAAEKETVTDSSAEPEPAAAKSNEPVPFSAGSGEDAAARNAPAEKKRGWWRIGPVGWAVASVAVALVLALAVRVGVSSGNGDGQPSFAAQSQPAGMEISADVNLPKPPTPTPATPIEVSAPKVTATPAAPPQTHAEPAADPVVSRPVSSPPPSDVAGEAESPDFPSILLSGIYFRAANPVAVVNGEMHHTGDLVEGARIVRISRSSIEVRYQGRNRVIELE